LKKLKIKNQVLINADSFDFMSLLPNKSIGAIVCDPPYSTITCAANGGRRQNNPKGRHQKDAATRTVGDLSIHELAFRTMFDEFERILRPDGRFFIFCDAQSYPAIMRAGYGRFKRSRLLVWNKTFFGLGQEFRKQFELIYSGCMDDAPMGKDETGKSICNQADILNYPPVPTKWRIHPAEKPVALIQNLLRFCVPGGRILDPFAGSGSTLVACQASGFKGIGIEIDPTFFNAAVNRLKGSNDGK
jgi:site-specific DNA-methyltransferase (adenine-specific)